jgi:carboxyl-terminal processing protease
MKKIVIPIVVALAVIAGILIGNILATRSLTYVAGSSGISPSGKIDAILNIVNIKYVDTVDSKNLTEEAIPKILSGLDPYSVYIPAQDLQSVNDELEGSFSGIGVQFNILHDTISIVEVISGGPSDKIGVMPGDRIVTVNDTLFVGKEISNDKVVKKLRGPKGTLVKIGVKRNGAKDLLDFTITRGDIPVSSVDVAYLITDNIGFIKVSKFGSNTYPEFMEALHNLRNSGADKFIIDLRGNAGGYLAATIEMTTEFLKKGELIVYTEGRSEGRRDAYAERNGLFQDAPIAVLIDEWSASASEIFAGAIQDNDRGFIIGRRSFGKGLVQQQIELRDGSAIRLTISRYYTPSGRNIQKPYDDASTYENDILNRYLHGELDDADSIKVNKVDSLEYRTAMGRIVYGGGGITPDIFVPRDTTGITSYFTKVNNSGYLYEFAFQYTDRNRAQLKSFTDYKSLEKHLNSENLTEALVAFASDKGVRRNPHLINKSRKLIENRLKAYIIRNTFGDSGYYPIINQGDAAVEKAVEELSSTSQNRLPVASSK